MLKYKTVVFFNDNNMNALKVSILNKLKSTISGFKEVNHPIYYLYLLLRFRRSFRFNWGRVRGGRNNVEKHQVVLNGVKYDVIGDQNHITISKWAILDGVVFHIRGNNNKVIIGSECIIKNSIIHIEDNECQIIIGNRTTIGGAELAATENFSKICIGNDCMFAYDIDIRTGDSHGIYDQYFNRINKAEDVVIGDHVWVAVRATILKGVVIGSESIVGAGAMVTKGIYPENSIIAGNPAKMVRQNVIWTKSRTDVYSDQNENSSVSL